MKPIVKSPGLIAALAAVFGHDGHFADGSLLDLKMTLPPPKWGGSHGTRSGYYSQRHESVVPLRLYRKIAGQQGAAGSKLARKAADGTLGKGHPR